MIADVKANAKRKYVHLSPMNKIENHIIGSCMLLEGEKIRIYTKGEFDLDNSLIYVAFLSPGDIVYREEVKTYG
jgi:hypothetical protein